MMDENDCLTTTRRLLADHEAYRRQTLNLIASENVVSPAVTGVLASDLVGRYADYRGADLGARRYKGNRFIIEIEREAARMARRVFHAEHVELRPIGGHLAGAAVLMALCLPGDLVLELGRDGGGHRLAGRMATTTFDVRSKYLPFDGRRYNLDLNGAIRLIQAERPRLVVLGSSNFLFPHPVHEIGEAVSSVEGAVLAYDASHVMGFLAAARFQDPLAEGADIVFGSTHKTLPGPQGGIIFSNNGELMERVTDALTPALVTNHHPFRIPALTVAMAEMEQWGPAFCDRVVTNANALGQALEAAGVPCIRVDDKYTRSHTILLAVGSFGIADDVAGWLEEAGVICNSALLPPEWGADGIRLGTQEVTRRGADEDLMQRVADVVAGVLQRRRSPGESAGIARELASTLRDVGFTWDRDRWED